jgi:lactoylglutathione lyase
MTAADSERRQAMAQANTIDIERVDHIGIRVRDLDRAMDFYGILGFTLLHKADFDAVAVIKNAVGVEINLIYNANAGEPGKNILMDVGEKYAGYTHVALRVGSITATIAALKANGITITQGPVTFGDGHVSVFVRDPDRNVIELRGRGEDAAKIEGVTQYVP